jgi:tetratricopeptide (TPR) repeat protein
VLGLPARDAPSPHLAARYVVDGSLLRDGDRLTVSVRGRDPETGENVWATRLEGPLADLDALQREVVDRIVAELEPAVLRLEHVRCERARADAIAVWDLCKRAEHRVDCETSEDYARAVALFEEAVALDRGSSRAWAGLALAHGAAVYLGFVDDLRKTATSAQEAARTAMALAPHDFESQLSLGRSLALSLEDEAAVPYLEGALECDPSSTLAASTLAGALRRRGHAATAIPYYERCLRLSPHGPHVHHVHGGLSLAHLSAGDYEAALACARRAVEGDPVGGHGKALDFYPVVPASLALLGRIDEARAAWAEAGAHVSRDRLRHSARFTGEGLEALVEGLRLAGWDGRLE